MKKIEEDVLQYIENKTKMIIKDGNMDDCGVDAEEISILLKKDRANVSRIINNLWKNNQLVKIFGRPVYYLDYKILKRAFPDANIPSFIDKGNLLSSYLLPKGIEDVVDRKSLLLDELIDINGSLNKQIDKVKAAINYPPYGLHTIISGNVGTEKSEIAFGMVEYARNKHVANTTSQYYVVDCYRYSDLEVLEKLLFGDEQSKGVFERIRMNYLIFENIEALSDQSLQLLNGILEKNAYFKDNKKIGLRCMFIITTSLSITDEKNIIISEHCPVKIELTDVDQRGAYEKMELVMYLFSMEAANIHKRLRVFKDVLYTIVKTKHKLNMIDLKNQIRLTCSDAFLSQSRMQTEDVNVHLYNLPQDMLQLNAGDLSKGDCARGVLDIIKNDYIVFEEDGHSKDFEYFKEFPNKSAAHLFSQFIDEFKFDINNLSDIDNYASENITCLKNLGKTQLMSLKKNIDPLILQVSLTVLFKYPEFCKLREHEELLYGILLHITNSMHHNKECATEDKSIEKLRQIYPIECQASKEIFDALYQYYPTKKDQRETIFLASYLVIANQWANQTKVAILVISHGDSIATQMVSYVRENVHGKYYLDAIDFKKALQLNDCMELACVKAVELNQGAGILVVSDKEPLDSISDYITSQTNIPSRTVSNLSLSLLLSLVQRTMSSVCDLSSLINVAGEINVENTNYQSQFIEKITKRVIARTLTFLDVNKAVDTLVICLRQTLEAIHLDYNDEIAAKYLCHCSNMIERVIKNETWENSKANKYARTYTDLIRIIDKSMQLVNNTYGIKVPKNELVYISEIFVPYLNDKVLNVIT